MEDDSYGGVQIFSEIPYLHWKILCILDRHMVFNVPVDVFETCCHEEDRGGSGRLASLLFSGLPKIPTKIN